MAGLIPELLIEPFRRRATSMAVDSTSDVFVREVELLPSIPPVAGSTTGAHRRFT